MVIADERDTAVCIRADHADYATSVRIQRKQSAVFQKHTGFQRSFVCKLQMFRTLDGCVRNTVVSAVFISERTEQITGGEEPDSAAGDVLFSDHSERIGVHDMLISTAAVEITSGLQGFGNRFRFVFCDMMILMKILDSPAVRDKVPFEAPFAAQLSHQEVACAAGFSVCAVIGAHNSFHVCSDKGPESRKIGFLQIFWRSYGIEMMAQSFRAAVDRKMFGTGGGFQLISAVALQPAHKGFTQPGSQKRIFSVGLMPAAPARITEDIDIGGPHRQPMVNIPVSFCRQGIVFCPCLRGDCIRYFLEKFLIKHGSKTDSLRKAGCGSSARQPVQSLIPPVVFRNAEAVDCRGVKTELAGLFVNRHL